MTRMTCPIRVRPAAAALVVCAAFAMLVASPAARAATSVAVFNFEMTSETPEWKWLQKGLADRIATDFVQERSLQVTARDEMQLLAEKLSWVPEMATEGPVPVAHIRRALKIDRLVTGVYRVTGGRVHITGQIVDVEGRTELAREDVEGPTGEVLALQRRLSATLLAWLSKRPAAEVLEELPVWTEAVPAARALYEGVDLYDQGRYGEAWLKFRQAVREDPRYVEAAYWVGKMYYFMDRYEHARRALERFIYLDTAHPRTGDAIKEYLHTHEQTGAPPEALLALYDDLRRRFPDVAIHNELGLELPVANGAWLRVRSAQLLADLGREAEAARLASEAVADLLGVTERTGWAYRVAMGSCLAHHGRTGEVLLPPGLVDQHHVLDYSGVLRFEPGQTEARVVLDRERKIVGRPVKGRTVYEYQHVGHLLVAPEGYVFKSLSLYPMVTGSDGKITCWLERDCHMDAGKADHKGPADAGERGFRFGTVPPIGIIRAMFYMHRNDPWRDPGLRFKGFRAVAEFERVADGGTVEVVCDNASSFDVYVDGVLARKRGGLVGRLGPGSHTVALRPRLGQSEYAVVERAVEVRAGEVERLNVVLPWKPDSPWRSWTAGARIGRDYPHRTPCLQDAASAPSIQADDEAIRVVWSWAGDLWSSESFDGERFSPPRRLPMPISSGWIEQDPLCRRDESGRFLLAFRSDREGQHEHRAYLCWSRDGTHWSSPSMVLPRSVNQFDFIQDRRGRFVWADASGSQVTVLRSRDGYRWEELARWALPNEERAVRIVERRDGALELFVAGVVLRVTESADHTRNMAVWRYVSRDGVAWGAPAQVAYIKGHAPISMSAVHVDGRTVLAILSEHVFTGFRPFVQFWREADDGSPQEGRRFWGVGSFYGSGAYHPRWGYLLAWQYPPNLRDTLPASGPFLVRGPDVAPFFEPEHPEEDSP